jgi:predicted alpha/beta-hydrolase family hydrolase
LDDVKVPMPFLQGTRDTLAELDQLKPVCTALGRRATLELFEAADHSFHAPARYARKDAEVLGEMLDFLCGWIDKIIAAN